MTAATAPTRDEISAAVQDAWREVMGAHIEMDKTLEWGGGDSLKVIQAVCLVEDKLRAEIPLDLVDPTATFGDLVLEIERYLQSVGAAPALAAKPTVFLLPGWGGDSAVMVRFRKSLADAVQFVVVDYPDMDTCSTAQMRDLDVIMQAVLDRIETTAPQGPVMLTGFSYGGLIALEAANRLQAKGRDVAFLGALDTLVSQELRRQTKPKSPLVWWGEFFHALRHGGWRWKLRNEAAEMVVRSGRYEFARKLGDWLNPVLPADAWRLRRHLVKRLRLEALNGWKPQPFNGRVTLFRTNLYTDYGATPDLGWNAVTNDLNVVHIGGGHLTMFEPPYIDVLRDAFAKAVTEAAATPARMRVGAA